MFAFQPAILEAAACTDAEEADVEADATEQSTHFCLASKKLYTASEDTSLELLQVHDKIIQACFKSISQKLKRF